MVRKHVSKLNLDKMKQRFVNQIIPLFSTNVPNMIRKEYKPKLLKNGKHRKKKLVSIELMLMTLFAATVSGTSIQAATKNLGDMQSESSYSWENLPKEIETNMEQLPDPNLVRRSLKLWKPKFIKPRFRKLIEKQIREMKHSKLIELIHGKFGNEGLSAAFDLTEVKYYGQNPEKMEFINYSKKKGGSKYCFAYLTLQIICPGLRLIIDVEPIHFDSKPMGEIMTKMLKRAKSICNLKINNIYVDRGFYRAEILQTFNDELSRRLIMPVVRSPMVKKTIISWYKKNGYSEGVKNVKITSPKSGHEQKYALIFKPKSDEERKKLREKQDRDVDDMDLDLINQDFIYFCVLKPIHKGETMAGVFDQIALEYSKRWGIETGYRVSKQVWAWTTSTSFNLRYWLMWTSIIVYNLWILENIEIHGKEIYSDNPRRRKSSEEVLDEIENEYTCCGLPTTKEVEKKKSQRKRSKLPPEERSTKEFPSRPWEPRPIEPIRNLSRMILVLVLSYTRYVYDKDELMQQGYDPPETA